MDVVNALWMAFLPLAILTFVIAYYSYKNGVISIHDEKDEWEVGEFWWWFLRADGAADFYGD